jgi:hypothetical protein
MTRPQNHQWAPREGGSGRKKKKRCNKKRTTTNCHGDQLRGHWTGAASCQLLGGASLVALRALQEYGKEYRDEFSIRLN